MGAPRVGSFDYLVGGPSDFAHQNADVFRSGGPLGTAQILRYAMRAVGVSLHHTYMKVSITWISCDDDLESLSAGRGDLDTIGGDFAT